MRAILFACGLAVSYGSGADTAEVPQIATVDSERQTRELGQVAVQRPEECLHSASASATAPGPLAGNSMDQELSEPLILYLRCTDFDCTGALQEVINIGPSQVPQLSRLVREGAPPQLAAELPGNAARTVRLKAVAALGAVRTPTALPPLTAALQSSDPLLRAESVRALGLFKFNHDAFVLLLPLLRDPDPLVRETTALALKQIGCRAALPELREALQAESAGHIRSAIMNAIRHLETP